MLGGKIAARLADRGIPFRALVRSGTGAPASRGAETVPGDLHDASTLPAALAGVDTVITTVTSIGRRLGGDKSVSIERTDVHGNENLVRAAETAGVRRFVFVSVPMSPQNERVPLPRAKRRTEELLERSSMRTTVIRPEMFQEVWLGPLVKLDWASGKALVFGRGETPHAYVAVDDVAEAAVRLALADDPPALIELGGPEALSRRDVIRRFEELSGRSMTVRHVPRGVLRTGSRVLARVNPIQASLLGMAYAADVQTRTLSAEPLRQLGIEPRPASAYIEQIARAG